MKGLGKSLSSSYIHDGNFLEQSVNVFKCDSYSCPEKILFCLFGNEKRPIRASYSQRFVNALLEKKKAEEAEEFKRMKKLRFVF